MYLFDSNSTNWPSTSGIYAISGIAGKNYVGMTAGQYGFASRWSDHRSALNAERHDNDYLQNSFNAHGPSGASFIILEEITSGDVVHYRERESHWQATLGATNRASGYNLYGYAHSGMSKLRHSDETRAIIAEKAMGRKHSPETRAKISALAKGRGSPSEETREKMSIAMKGKTLSEEAKRKISVANKGRKLSAEHCAIMSENNKRMAARLGDDHWNAKEYECLDPQGNKIKIKNVTKFARDHGISEAHLLDVCANKRLSHFGYRSLTYVDKRYRVKKYDFMAPDGSIKECYVIRAFAKEHGLTQAYVYRLVKGHISTRKGWKLIKDYTK